MVEGNASEWSSPTLRDLREAAGLSQEALARLVNVSLRSVQTWEKGASKPGLDKAVALGRALGTSLKGIAKSMGLNTIGLLDDFSEIGPPISDHLSLWQLSRPQDDRPYFGPVLPIGLPNACPQLEGPVPPETKSQRRAPVPTCGIETGVVPVPLSDRPQLEQPVPPEEES